MNYTLSSSAKKKCQKIRLPGSKSESNRLLILQAFYPEISVENLSDSDDTVVLQKALSSHQKIIDIGHAGTAMRFLTAYYSNQEHKQILLTGSKRMQERPIGILVDALRDLGAKIEYEKNEGYPPLKIYGKKLNKNRVQIDAAVSSQYITALMLIAPSMKNGLTIELKNKPTSFSYIYMTRALLEKIGVKTTFKENLISIKPAIESATHIKIESDWSGASYFYSLAALSQNADVSLTNFQKNSIQGDRVVADYFKELGVETNFTKDTIQLKKSLNTRLPKLFIANLISSPDLAQTIAVTCFGLKIDCHLEGLHTLKIKETDRLRALKNELEKLGAQVSITSDSIYVKAADEIRINQNIQTYQDHRMAMAFTPLALKTPLVIEDVEVVSKSFPQFWKAVQSLGIDLQESI